MSTLTNEDFATFDQVAKNTVILEQHLLQVHGETQPISLEGPIPESGEYLGTQDLGVENFETLDDNALDVL